MNFYKVVYLDDLGNKGSKIIELEDENQLQPYLDAIHLNVLSIEKVPAYRRFFDLRSRLQRANKKQIIEILENLQVVIRSGLPMNTALEDMAADADTPVVKDMLLDISHRIQMSMSLSEAMEKYSDRFGETTIGLVKIGEETGKLEETLKNAVQYLERVEGLKSNVKSSLILPAITFVILMIAMTFWMVKVMPEVVSAFKSFDMELPLFTRIFMSFSVVIRENFISFITILVILIVAFIVFRRTHNGFRFFTDKMLLKLPIVGNISKQYNYAYISEYTRLMISAGIPLYTALGILKNSLSNLVFKRSIEETRELISNGESFSNALSEQKLFSNLIIRMITVGEQTGRLEGQLQYISDFYYEKVDNTAQNITKLLQPMITVVLGLFLIAMVVAFILPIMDMVTGINR